ncbi:adipocyte plasma membrane-associated protein [Biomphalaria pfeifferi]|uniref:Adipocyte plasma membrane-associated protein n=1 Tax=Biomphalaria pfeifferi TaxID=112525 RepID=A0AAD8FGP7_BIOPF|nr:adipocyte plasma membrane-associated protein [Biomphalaria pfeifferi]
MSSFWAFLLSCVIAAASVFVLLVLPSPIDPEPLYISEDLPELIGPLQVNTNLQNIKKLFQSQLVGPESFAAGPDGSLYTGTADGKIWRIKDGQLKLVTRTGRDDAACGQFHMEPLCGRPKGMKLDSEGYLIVADSYKGILKVNVDTGDKQVLLDNFNGSRFLFLNALDIARNGTIYFTDSSTKWERRNYRYEVIESNSLGRIIALDPITLTSWLVTDGLYLANGLYLSEDQSFLLVAEMSVSRLSKVYIDGSKSGEKEVFITNLPGYPDNIKPNARGNLYVGMGSVRFQGSSAIGSFLDIVAPYPFIKRFITKIFPPSFFDIFLPQHALMLEISLDGRIVTSHHDPGAKTLYALSEAFQYEDYVYIGHFNLPFIGVIEVKHLHPD